MAIGRKKIASGAVSLYGKGLLYEYSLILMGELNAFSSAYFGNKSVDNKGFAQFIFHQAFEVFLRWTPDEVYQMFDKEILLRMKLDKVIGYLNLPPEIERNQDYHLIAAYLYPETIHVDASELVIQTYEAVLKGQENGGLYKFPKHYFDGQTGRQRAHICFRYMIEHQCSFNSVKEMYLFFSSDAGTRLINNQGLKLVLKDVFHSPVLFLHESLPDGMKDEFWYHYYEFQYRYKKEKAFREKCAKNLSRTK